ncbi:MAG TPA: PspC domain-containing protein [Streptosporangiaceae bacterium]|jgi:signal transduction histidine kinase
MTNQPQTQGRRHRHDPFRLHQPPNGQLRRDPAQRIAGGVAAGLAAWKGYNVTTVRIVFVLITVVTSGTGVALYVAAWLFLPAADQDASIAAKARNDSKGIALAVGLAVLLTVFLLVAGVFNDGWLAGWAWPQVFSVAGLTLIWRNAPEEEQASLKRMVEPLEAAAGGSSRGKLSVARIVLAGVLLIAGVTWLATDKKEIALLRPLGAVVLVIAAIVLLLGPWWLRIGRDLVEERQARVRLEERAEVASRVHDSVLQTLALIQRQAEDPQKVISLARVQERELRDVLFGGPGSRKEAEGSFASALRELQQDVESRYGVQVEMVTVGECMLTDRVDALVAAAREATVNAAKWSGVSVISLFAEVEGAGVEGAGGEGRVASVVVRDRGKGFDPSSVQPDRKGVAESIRGRMARFGGTAVITSEIGEGTKVTLTMPCP